MYFTLKLLKQTTTPSPLFAVYAVAAAAGGPLHVRGRRHGGDRGRGRGRSPGCGPGRGRDGGKGR